VPIIHALVLGIAQGLSEFLPISSSAHLELIPWLFGWDDFGDDAALENAFDVALHLGTTIGAAAYLWPDVKRYAAAGLKPLFTSTPLGRDGRIAWLLLLSALPAGLAALLFEDALLEIAETIWVIGVMLIVFGLVLWFCDRLPGTRPTKAFGWSDALAMGTGQAISLIPGASRSGTSISAGRLVRFDRPSAARLAFLMSLPIIAGAGLVRGIEVVQDGLPGEMVGGFIVGAAASAVTGWLAVWATLTWVRTRSFTPFVIYRVALGVLVLALLASPYR
jgi:undecaprenyl-diphosphatase